MEMPKSILLHPAHAQCITSSRIIHKGPCLITGFSVTGDGAGGGAKLYDGENNLGELKANIRVVAETTFEWDLTHPVDFDKGIYVELNVAGKTYVTICYIPESWKAFI